MRVRVPPSAPESHEKSAISLRTSLLGFHNRFWIRLSFLYEGDHHLTCPGGIPFSFANTPVCLLGQLFSRRSDSSAYIRNRDFALYASPGIMASAQRSCHCPCDYAGSAPPFDSAIYRHRGGFPFGLYPCKASSDSHGTFPAVVVARDRHCNGRIYMALSSST